MNGTQLAAVAKHTCENVLKRAYNLAPSQPPENCMHTRPLAPNKKNIGVLAATSSEMYACPCLQPWPLLATALHANVEI
jgi:hypothetical protein